MEEKDYFKEWNDSNRPSLLCMKNSMQDNVRGAIQVEINLAKAFLEAVTAKYQTSNKEDANTHLAELVSMKFDGSGSIRDHLMRMVERSSKLADLKILINEWFLVHLALNSSPLEYGTLNVTYNLQKDKWGVDELITQCVQEELRQKKEKIAMVNYIQSSKNKPLAVSGKKFKASHKASKFAMKPHNPLKTSASHNTEKEKQEFKCYFRRKPGHARKDCADFKAWMKKKGFHKTEKSK